VNAATRRRIAVRARKEAAAIAHEEAVARATEESHRLLVRLGIRCGHCGATIGPGFKDQPCDPSCAGDTRVSL
jgi:peptide methionine sulfoxide reductase MsrB